MTRSRPTVWSLLRALLVVVCSLGLALPLGIGILLGRNNSHPTRLRPELSLSAFGSRARVVHFETADGLVLEGAWSPPRATEPILVFAHGIGANRDDWAPWGKLFSEAGYGVLLFDWRAHGNSRGETLRFGAVEWRDLLAALEWVEAQPEARARSIGIVAASLGAAITAQAAPRLPPSVRCLMLDSPFGSLSRMIENRAAPFGVLGVAVPQHLPGAPNSDQVLELLPGTWEKFRQGRLANLDPPDPLDRG